MHPCHSFAHWSPSAIFLSLDSIGYINNIYSNVFLNLSIFLELPLFSFPIAHLLSPPSPLRHLYLHIRRRPREFLRLTKKTKVCICFSPPPSLRRLVLHCRFVWNVDNSIENVEHQTETPPKHFFFLLFVLFFVFQIGSVVIEVGDKRGSVCVSYESLSLYMLTLFIRCILASVFCLDQEKSRTRPRWIPCTHRSSLLLTMTGKRSSALVCLRDSHGDRVGFFFCFDSVVLTYLFSLRQD